MQRKAFTMIELIVVIIIIGILAVTALPKFMNTKNLAKINSEMMSMSSLDSPIMAEMEVQSKRFGNTKVNWHNYAEMSNDEDAARAGHYKNINDDELVLSKVAKRNRSFKIVGFKAIDASGNDGYTDGLFCDAILLKIEASKADSGAKYPLDVAGQDVLGEPDKNDFWVFNSSTTDITIESINPTKAPINTTVVESGEIKLIDVNGTSAISSIADIGVKGLTNSVATVYPFVSVTP